MSGSCLGTNAIRGVDKANAAARDAGEYYVAIYQGEGDHEKAVADLKTNHVMFFGHDYVFAKEWAKYMADNFDEKWVVVKTLRPGEESKHEPTEG